MYAAERLASAGFMVVAADLPGHGRSAGLRGYLPCADEVVKIGARIADHARRRFGETRRRRRGTAREGDSKNGGDADEKLFLVGSSMGGTIALAVALRMTSGGETPISGVALLAPMLKLSVSGVERYLLRGLAAVFPTWEVIPSSSSDSSKQYRDPAKRKRCDEDEHSASNKSGTIRAGSACTCVELACCIRDEFAHVDFPILVMVGDDDVVVDNAGSVDLVDASASADKTLKRYPALHGLLCEPSPLVDTIQDDLVEWMNARADK